MSKYDEKGYEDESMADRWRRKYQLVFTKGDLSESQIKSPRK